MTPVAGGSSRLSWPQGTVPCRNLIRLVMVAAIVAIVMVVSARPVLSAPGAAGSGSHTQSWHAAPGGIHHHSSDVIATASDSDLDVVLWRNLTAGLDLHVPDMNATIKYRGEETRVFIPGGELNIDDASRSLCAVLEPSGASYDACLATVSVQLSRRRNQRMMYRRWIGPGPHLMTFDIPDGKSILDAAKATCDEVFANQLKPGDTLTFRQCLEMAVGEIQVMRRGKAWKTRTPDPVPAGTEAYWPVVHDFETAIEDLGHMIYDGHTAHCPNKIKFFFQVAMASPSIKHVCEVGFNAGHSALAWLMARPDIRVTSFDLGSHHYVEPAAKEIDKRFPGRLKLIIGDSAQTVPQYFAAHPNERCHVVFIDGDHLYEPVLADIENFRNLVSPEGHVVILDDFGCAEFYCRTVRTAFYKMVHEFKLMERSVVMSQEYTHLVGGGEVPVINGMAAGYYTTPQREQQLRQQFELVPM